MAIQISGTTVIDNSRNVKNVIGVGETSTTFFYGNGSLLTNLPVEIPSGTLMLFQQTSAPTGWTKQTTHNNKALRVVTGTASSGGVTDFTTIFQSRTIGGTVGDTTLSSAQIASHNHSITYHSAGTGAVVARGTGGSLGSTNTANTGGGGAHTHSFTGNALDFSVQYVDLIIASKN
jgi:hypothetical protein